MCKAFSRILALGLATFLVTAVPVTAEKAASAMEDRIGAVVFENISGTDYLDYINGYSDASAPFESLTLNGADFKDAVPAASVEMIGLYEGKSDVSLIQEENQTVTYSFTVAEAGFYSVGFEFYPLDTESAKEEISLKINGKTPFAQAQSLYLYYGYIPESSEPIKTASGDEFASRRIINKAWNNCVLTNPDHDFDGPLKFYFNEGVNTLTLENRSENGYILGSINIGSVAENISYEEYLKAFSENNGGNASVYTEAEDIALQSDSTVNPVCDQSDPLISPYSAETLKINVINESWGSHGQWLDWNINVEQEGWYSLTVRYKQDTLKGLNVGRCLYIDGEIPFKEASCLQFPYTSSWEQRTLCGEDGKPYYFYLKKGSHTIRMEAVLGELAEIIREIDDVVYELNTAYRSVVMITSATADKYRDYQIASELPELSSQLKSCAERLEKCNRSISELAGGSSADSTILVTTASQLRSMIDDIESVPYRLSSWQSNIGSISSWNAGLRSQPLQMDYFIFAQSDYQLPKGKAGIFKSAFHSIKRFFLSFIKDYNDLSVSSEDAVTLTIWLGTGRDQAEVLWRMTNDLFTPQTNIQVRVKLVSATMVEAFLSGQAPDLSVQTARDIPINLAVRGALLDLSTFEGFNGVTEWFTEDAIVPYTMQGCVYGLPDTQSFNMLFYRTDVFEELGLSVPETWEEFVNVANQLHLHQLETGIPVDIDTSMYYTLLMQRGGEVFTDNLSTTLLDSQVSIEAFSYWTELFTETGLPVTFNFFNRFRSGEMPMAIQAYTNYNQLISAAPEIRNLWEMTEIPGIRQPDGTIKRTESATGTAAVILSSTEYPEEAWSFLKWWVGDAAQTRYAQDIESRIGTIGRVASANTKALMAQDYPSYVREALLSQRNAVCEIPQVPGNYYLDRDLLNAFRDVIYNDRNAKESILDYSHRINNEIARKRKELGIE